MNMNMKFEASELKILNESQEEFLQASKLFEAIKFHKSMDVDEFLSNISRIKIMTDHSLKTLDSIMVNYLKFSEEFKFIENVSMNLKLQQGLIIKELNYLLNNQPKKKPQLEDKDFLSVKIHTLTQNEKILANDPSKAENFKNLMIQFKSTTKYLNNSLKEFVEDSKQIKGKNKLLFWLNENLFIDCVCLNGIEELYLPKYKNFLIEFLEILKECLNNYYKSDGSIEIIDMISGKLNQFTKQKNISSLSKDIAIDTENMKMEFKIHNLLDEISKMFQKSNKDHVISFIFSQIFDTLFQILIEINLEEIANYQSSYAYKYLLLIYYFKLTIKLLLLGLYKSAYKRFTEEFN